MAALAGIGRMPDTIEDRAVIIRMRRRAPHERVSPYRLKRDGPPLNQLKFRLHAWARHHLPDLARAEPDMPLEDRAADTWEALIAIADQAGGHWPDRARHAATKLVGQVLDDDETSLPIQLLTDCYRILEGHELLRTETLITELRADLEGPWASYGHAGLTARHLATLLREFDIRSGTYRFPNGGKAKGYARNAFLDAWTRYLPPSVTNSDSRGDPSENRGKRGKRGTPGHRPGTATDSRNRHGNNRGTSHPTTTDRDHPLTLPIENPGDHHE